MYEPEHKYTVEEYLEVVRLDPQHKYEYSNGHIRMMTGGSPAHSQLAMNVGVLLSNALNKSECNVYSSDAAIRLSEQRRYYPDVSVSCDPADWTREDHLESPTVVVEVLSPTTEKIDKLEKLEAYQRFPTIQDILYVDSRKRYIEHWHRIGISKWEYSYYMQENEVIALVSLDISFTAKQVYHKVYLKLEDVEQI